MSELTEEQIKWIYDGIGIVMWQKAIILRDADREDFVSHALLQCVRQWMRYDPQKSTWKTYMWMVIECAVKSTYCWWYRQHWRIPMCEMPDDDCSVAASCDDGAVKCLVAEIFGDDETLREVCWLRYEGYTRDEIVARGYTVRQYAIVSDRLRQKYGDNLGRRGKYVTGKNRADGNHA